ncbi:MAG: DUF3788 domain-containing protein [Chloroflexi bacterium]|nr:MAG: DUF3788 domain-containing protein [Chloroflexota bacterium]MBL1192763.1 DUF3788 domain-containing protein [Chloroflexota bacterium]NOH10057.1 DUF3788 domain-containing protein [Chloroflexota bacterium]
MSYERLLNKEQKPGEEQIVKTIGENAPLWLDMRTFIEAHYDFVPEVVFFTKKYGWTIRYRKSGKTLVYLFPEAGAFSILLVLGRKEAEKAEEIKSQLNSKVRSVFENTEQLHDGRWLWIRVLSKSDVESVKLLLQSKRKSIKV